MNLIHQTKRNQAIRRTTLKGKVRKAFSIIMVSLVILAALMGTRLFATEKKSVIQIAQPAPVTTGEASESLTIDSSISWTKPLVGIVSGHKGYDSGAVCGDGLTEAEINYTIALEVVDLLKRRGIQADLLEEYDDRLTDYRADALISIHADSCNVPGATGFKVARVTNSAIPAAEDQLVACLNQEYAAYTGLPQHPASITDNMTNYHAFNEIAPLTPGAIIETGFMLDDRYLLQYKPKIVARGIAAGLICFLEK